MSTEMNTELLERLKVDRAEHLAEEYGTAAIATTELKFLVQQAERVQELEREIDHLRRALDEIRDASHVMECPYCSDVEVIAHKALNK